MNYLTSFFFALAVLGTCWLVLTRAYYRSLDENRLLGLGKDKKEANLDKGTKETTSVSFLKKRQREQKAKESLILSLLLISAAVSTILWEWAAPSEHFLPRLAMMLGLILVIRRFLYLNAQIRRRVQIEEDLPAILDLIVVCIEAGMSINAAIIRVSNEMRKSPLSEELKHTFHELNLGLPTQEAFHNLGERTKVADLRSLATAIVQSQQLGISLGETLRNQSRVLRENIRLRTREKILKIPIKLIFPLVLFVMPAIFTVVAGPSFGKVLSGVIVNAAESNATLK